MKKTGVALVIVGMMVASLLLTDIALAPQVAASSEKATTKLANGVVGSCPGALRICCFNENGRTVCGCMLPTQCPLYTGSSS
jgi:hypothetical protein